MSPRWELFKGRVNELGADAPSHQLGAHVNLAEKSEVLKVSDKDKALNATVVGEGDEEGIINNAFHEFVIREHLVLEVVWHNPRRIDRGSLSFYLGNNGYMLGAGIDNVDIAHGVWLLPTYTNY